MFPPGQVGHRPFVRLVFRAEVSPLSSLSRIADIAWQQVAGLRAPDGVSPIFVVTATADQAEGARLIGYAYTTVIARVSAIAQFQTWATALAPLRVPFGGVIRGNLELVAAAVQPNGQLDLSEQVSRAQAPGPVATGLREGLSLVKLALWGAVLIGLAILVKETRKIVS